MTANSRSNLKAIPDPSFHWLSDTQIAELNDAAATGSESLLCERFNALRGSEEVLELYGDNYEKLSSAEKLTVLRSGTILDRMLVAIDIARHRKYVYTVSQTPQADLKVSGQGIDLFEAAVETLKSILAQFPVLIDPRFVVRSWTYDPSSLRSCEKQTVLQWIACTPGLRLPTDSTLVDKPAAERFEQSICLKRCFTVNNQNGYFTNWILNLPSQSFIAYTTLLKRNVSFFRDIFEIQNQRKSNKKIRTGISTLLHPSSFSITQVDWLGRILGSALTCAGDPKSIHNLYGSDGEHLIDCCVMIMREATGNDDFLNVLHRKIREVVADLLELRMRWETNQVSPYDFGGVLTNTLYKSGMFPNRLEAGQFLLDQVIGPLRIESEPRMRAADEAVISFVEGVSATSSAPKPYVEYDKLLACQIAQLKNMKSTDSQTGNDPSRDFEELLRFAGKISALSSQIRMNDIITVASAPSLSIDIGSSLAARRGRQL